MPTTIIKNITTLTQMGILADRTEKSPSLDLRRYNLIYGFNGSGKSTLSRLFASLESGVVDSRLPTGGAFSITLDNGVVHASPNSLTGLEKRVLVFNGDFVERNLQWGLRKAKPVFFIGENQATAATELAKLEATIEKLTARQAEAAVAANVAEKALISYKRDAAKLTAARLHLGNRKYEANHLQADYDKWSEAENTTLDDAALNAAEDRLRADKAAPPLAKIADVFANIANSIEAVREICARTISRIALNEVERHPDMFLWIKEGQEYHESNSLELCLYCGNEISQARRASLARSLDNQIDQFIASLDQMIEQLRAQAQQLDAWERALPTPDTLQPELIADYRSVRIELDETIQSSMAHLKIFDRTLVLKRDKPATAVDLSELPTADQVKNAATALKNAVAAANVVIERRNDIATNFQALREAAAESLRKHGIAECRLTFAEHIAVSNGAFAAKKDLEDQVDAAGNEAEKLRQKIRVHKPAADAINRLIESYLGHGELTIHPIDEGYEFHRHAQIIDGLPSEGEKTAIALAYFLSTVESDGRKLENLLIVIDDPISSLDTKALNFACALVRSRLSTAGQLIVLTHNQQCMNEFRKEWKNKARPPDGKGPTAAFLFLDVRLPQGASKRAAHIVPLSKLLREYDSEYHFLFSQVLSFSESSDSYSENAYMMPNVLRRVLDVFLAFRCPGTDGLKGKVQKICNDFDTLDRTRMTALERLSQVESHSENLDDLIAFSAMTLEESREATRALLEMMEHVDERHFKAMKSNCTA